MKDNILKHYHSRFSNPQIYVHSPGRANIIGEHTDYNHGLVLPFAIEHAIHMYLGRNELGLMRLYAIDIDEYAEIDLSRLDFQSEGWTRYFINALVAIEYDGSVGLDVAFGGNLPQGGGISSSSALTCGFLAGFNAFASLNHSIDHLIDLASQAENGIGLNGGIMDQTSIFKGKENHALLIDFLDFSVQECAMPPDDYSFYLFNSGQKHDLVETGYNDRRRTCETALNKIKAVRPDVKTMRDVTFEDIDAILSDEVEKKRCTHVLSENKRVEETVTALQGRNIDLIGPLLLQSHQSLSCNYEVSTPEIDYLVERSGEIPQIRGSRIMGGGFGGCTINLSHGQLSKRDIEILQSDYHNRTGYHLTVEKISAGDGIKVVVLNEAN